MALGRRAGQFHETLAERAENWLDDNFEARRRIGARGATIVEQANHLVASAAFGAAYGAMRPYLVRNLPLAAAGAAFGSGLYGFNIVTIAPIIGLTRGEWREATGIPAQRLAMHVLFGVVTEMATAALLGSHAFRQSISGSSS